MKVSAIRNARWALILAAACATGACVHAPTDRTLKGPAHTPAGATPPPGALHRATAPGKASSTYPGDIVPPAAQGASGLSPEETLASQSIPVVGLTPPQFADLFDRIRAGFALDEVDKRAVDLELNWYAGNPEYLERAFGRAELYLHHIVSEVEARNMPLELALLPIIESAFEPFAYSRARASGLWQFIPGTGSRFGLKQNWWYDGRRDVVESTRAALDYLQYLYEEFDDWLLAIAGYNCGEAAVARAIENNRAAGKPTDFWHLKLPKETRAYVPKLLAMKRLVADPEAYGIGFSMIPNQPYFARVETYGQIDLKLAADIAGITYEELYELNPAFHRWATDPSGPHYLLLPLHAAEVFRQNIGQLTPEQRVGAQLYTVQAGDSVSAIAKRFNTTPAVIRELNELPSGPLVIGSQLRVPASEVKLPPKVALAAARVDGRDRAARPHVHVVRKGDSLWRIARRHGMNVDTLAMINGMSPTDTIRAGQKLRLTPATGSAKTTKTSSTTTAAASGDGRDVTYVVRRGDTLSAIARLFQVTVAELVSWNDISVNTPIKPGQKLMIRVAGSRS